LDLFGVELIEGSCPFARVLNQLSDNFVFLLVVQHLQLVGQEPIKENLALKLGILFVDACLFAPFFDNLHILYENCQVSFVDVAQTDRVLVDDNFALDVPLVEIDIHNRIDFPGLLHNLQQGTYTLLNLLLQRHIYHKIEQLIVIDGGVPQHFLFAEPQSLAFPDAVQTVDVFGIFELFKDILHASLGDILYSVEHLLQNSPYFIDDLRFSNFVVGIPGKIFLALQLVQQLEVSLSFLLQVFADHAVWDTQHQCRLDHPPSDFVRDGPAQTIKDNQGFLDAPVE